jgi:hypothetical protein
MEQESNWLYYKNLEAIIFNRVGLLPLPEWHAAKRRSFFNLYLIKNKGGVYFKINGIVSINLLFL